MQLGWVSVQWRQLGDARFVVHAACVICQRVQKSFPRCRRLVRRLFRRIQSMLSSQLNPWLTPLLHMIEFYPHCVHKELLRKKKTWSKRIQQQPLFMERSLYALANIAVALRFLEYGYALLPCCSGNLETCKWRREFGRQLYPGPSRVLINKD